MYKMKYCGPFNGPEWTLATYREVITVKNGYCTVRYPETVQTLKLQGFQLVEQDDTPKPSPHQKKESIKPVATPSSPRQKPELSQAEMKILELLKKGANLSAIAVAIKWKKSKIENWVRTHNKLVAGVVNAAGPAK